MMEKCRLCGAQGYDFTPIFSGKLNIAGRILTCLPIRVMETNDLPQSLCDSCGKVVDISYKMILKSMEIDREFRNSILENLDSQKSNMNHIQTGYMEPQVLVISHTKNHGEQLENLLVVKKENEDMEIDVSPDAHPAEHFFNQDIKIYCYEDSDDMLINLSQKKRILTEHSYAVFPEDIALSDRIILDHNSLKLMIATTLSVLRDHNYFKKTGDSLIENFERLCNYELSTDHNYYERNSSFGRKRKRTGYYPCKLYPKTFTSLMSIDSQEFMNSNDTNYPWPFGTDVKTTDVVEEDVWRENQVPEFVLGI